MRRKYETLQEYYKDQAKKYLIANTKYQIYGVRTNSTLDFSERFRKS